MEHIFLIDMSEGNEKYNQYTKEVIDKFLNLFPEHKDKFKIHIKNKDKFYNIPLNELTKDNPQMEEVDYNNHYQDANVINSVEENNFDRVNGWLFNNAQKDVFFHYCIPTSKPINNGLYLGRSALFSIDERYKKMPPEFKKKYSKTSYVAADTTVEPKKFKSILMHELGHAFHATHEDRQNIKNTDAGCHCNNAGCLMQDGRENAATRDKEPDFCQDCITSMKQYMNSLFNENSNTNTNAITATDNPEKLSPSQEEDDSYKTAWRIFADKVRISLGADAKLTIDNKSPNFSATITDNEGNKTSITASSANDVALGAQKADGTPDIPDQKVFDELAKKALRDGSDINFGDIKDNEFKARLMIACQAAGVKMIGAPEINKEFLDSLDKTSRNKLAPTNNSATNKQVSISQLTQ